MFKKCLVFSPGSGQDPYPHWPNMVDPDLLTINTDPHPCFYLFIMLKSITKTNPSFKEKTQYYVFFSQLVTHLRKTNFKYEIDIKNIEIWKRLKEKAYRDGIHHKVVFLSASLEKKNARTWSENSVVLICLSIDFTTVSTISTPRIFFLSPSKKYGLG